MKHFWKEIVVALFLVLVMPWLTYAMLSRPAEQTQQDTTAYTIVPETENVNVWMEDRVQSMPLSDYLTGVLLCEIPGSFHMEAKKAQAVVARTYTLRTVSSKDKHPEQSVCTDSACCQGYRSPEEYIALGGTQKVIDQAAQAVSATRGTVLTYEGELIDATYFSCSGGQTEDAVAVWGSDVPYLQSVESPGEEAASHYTDEVSFTPEQLQQALGVQLSGKPESWIGDVTYTRGGGVDTMTIGGKAYSGTTLRSALGLRSTAFTVEIKDDLVIFTTKGFGHRVGMSQYGADAMAETGKTWQEILLHYYTDTEIVQKEATAPSQ